MQNIYIEVAKFCLLLVLSHYSWSSINVRMEKYERGTRSALVVNLWVQIDGDWFGSGTRCWFPYRFFIGCFRQSTDTLTSNLHTLSQREKHVVKFPRKTAKKFHWKHVHSTQSLVTNWAQKKRAQSVVIQWRALSFLIRATLHTLHTLWYLVRI